PRSGVARHRRGRARIPCATRRPSGGSHHRVHRPGRLFRVHTAARWRNAGRSAARRPGAAATRNARAWRCDRGASLGLDTLVRGPIAPRSAARALESAQGRRRLRSADRRHRDASRGGLRGAEHDAVRAAAGAGPVRTNTAGKRLKIQSPASSSTPGDGPPTIPHMDARSIVANGLTVQNPGLVQLLGLCPLLAVSTTVAYGLGLGLATIAVLVISNTLAALIGRWLLPEIRIAVFVVVIAAAVTAVELTLSAWLPGIYAGLG